MVPLWRRSALDNALFLYILLSCIESGQPTLLSKKTRYKKATAYTLIVVLHFRLV